MTITIAALLAVWLWQSDTQTLAQAEQLPEALPALQVHSLPSTLAAWQPDSQDDYFEQVSPSAVGYLIWSEFPVRVFVEPPHPTANDRSADWTSAVNRAAQEWSQHLPLELVDVPAAADIRIWRRSPPLRGWGDRLQRARSAETRCEFYVHQGLNRAAAILSHRCEIWLRPSQTDDYIQAAARHELGHAIGIWGHSPLATDALYFSQVRTPPAISHRDVNTLKRVYQQPTRLGWAVE